MYDAYKKHSYYHQCQMFYSLLFAAGVPKGLSFSDLKDSLVNIPGVVAVHDLHVWSLTVGTSAIAVHLVIGKSMVVIEEKEKMGDLATKETLRCVGGKMKRWG